MRFVCVVLTPFLVNFGMWTKSLCPAANGKDLRSVKAFLGPKRGINFKLHGSAATETPKAKDVLKRSLTLLKDFQTAAEVYLIDPG